MKPFRCLDRDERILASVGSLALWLGFGFTITETPRSTKNTLSLAIQILPLWAYGLIWTVVGVYCIIAAFATKRMRGFTVASSMFALWGFIYLGGWLHGDPGRGWLSAIIFFTMSSIIYQVSGPPEPMPRPRVLCRKLLRRCP